MKTLHLPEHNRLLWISLCGLLLLLGANTVSREVAEQRRKRIAGMSPGTKAQLQQNFERFKNMTREEQNYYRNMHQDIHSDPNIAKLRSTMVNYHQWAKMLPPAQRDELRNTSDLTARIQLIQKFQQEEKTYSQKSDLAQAISTLGPNFNWLKQLSTQIDGRFTQVVRIEDFDAMISYIEQELPEAQREAVIKTSGLHQSLDVLAFKIYRPDTGGNFRPGVFRDWIDERQVHDLIEQISNPDLQKRIRFKTDTKGKEVQTTYLEQRPIIARFLLAGLIRKIQQHIQSKKPSDEELLNYMENELDAKNRDEIYLLPSEQWQRRLLFLYLTEHTNQQSQIDSKKLRTVIGALAVLGGMRQRTPDGRPLRPPKRRLKDEEPPRGLRGGKPFRLRPKN